MKQNQSCMTVDDRVMIKKKRKEKVLVGKHSCKWRMIYESQTRASGYQLVDSKRKHEAHTVVCVVQ